MSKKSKYVVIVVLITCILILGTGFSIMSERFTISGNARLTREDYWNVEITGVSVDKVIGSARDSGNITFSGNYASFSALLYENGDSIEYVVTYTNRGTLDAKIGNLTAYSEPTTTGSAAIIYEVLNANVDDTLLVGESKNFTIRVTYNSELLTNPNLTSRNFQLVIDFVQKV